MFVMFIVCGFSPRVPRRVSDVGTVAEGGGGCAVVARKVPHPLADGGRRFRLSAADAIDVFSFDQLSSAQIHIAGGASKTWQNH